MVRPYVVIFFLKFRRAGDFQWYLSAWDNDQGFGFRAVFGMPGVEVERFYVAVQLFYQFTFGLGFLFFSGLCILFIPHFHPEFNGLGIRLVPDFYRHGFWLALVIDYFFYF